MVVFGNFNFCDQLTELKIPFRTSKFQVVCRQGLKGALTTQVTKKGIWPDMTVSKFV